MTEVSAYPTSFYCVFSQKHQYVAYPLLQLSPSIILQYKCTCMINCSGASQIICLICSACRWWIGKGRDSYSQQFQVKQLHLQPDHTLPVFTINARTTIELGKKLLGVSFPINRWHREYWCQRPGKAASHASDRHTKVFKIKTCETILQGIKKVHAICGSY